MIKFYAFNIDGDRNGYRSEFVFKDGPHIYHLSKWIQDNGCTVAWSGVCSAGPLPTPRQLAQLIPQHVYIKALLMEDDVALRIRNERLRG